MAKGQKQKKMAVPSPLALAKKMKKFQKKMAKDAAARTPHASDANEVGDAAAGRKENGARRRLAGFLFLSGVSMTRQFLHYGMFGLPMKWLESVEKIRKGTNLFLYDYELKQLYGGYQAISNGGLNLEAAAFNGTRPAQVKFKIVYGCMPLHRDVFKHVVLENGIVSKFNPELNSEQVKKLMSLLLWPPPTRMFGERHLLAPDYRSVIPPPQDAYRQPVTGTGLPIPSYRGKQSRIMGLLKQVEGIKEGLLKQVEGIEGLLQTLKVIQREQPPAPPSRDYGSLKATEGERASRAGHPPSAE